MADLSSIDKRHLWYTVGLIATDGNLSNDQRHIIITSKDCDFLCGVRDALKLSVKIGRKNSGSNKEKIYGSLQFGDVKFYRFLEKIGLTRKKSLTLGSLDIPDKYFVDFLRGVIDGDGNIQETVHTSNGNTQWVLRIVSGSPLFLPWLKEKIERIIKIEGRLHQNPSSARKNPLHILKFGKFAAKVILRRCYYDGALALERKLKIAHKCIDSENGLSVYGKFKAT